MKLTKSVSFLLLLALTNLACAGNLPDQDSVLAELSRCDGRFFASLQRHAPELSANPYFTKFAELAYFKVADRTAPELSVRRFSSPLKIDQLDVTGYFDTYLRLSSDDSFISWGFLLRASPQAVVKAVQRSLWDNERLLQDGLVYTRTELWDPAQAGNGWQKVMTPGGIESSPDSVERILRIEADEKDPSLTRFGCVLQGSLPSDMLKDLRPDISAKSPGAK